MTLAVLSLSLNPCGVGLLQASMNSIPLNGCPKGPKPHTKDSRNKFLLSFLPPILLVVYWGRNTNIFPGRSMDRDKSLCSMLPCLYRLFSFKIRLVFDFLAWFESSAFSPLVSIVCYLIGKKNRGCLTCLCLRCF